MSNIAAEFVNRIRVSLAQKIIVAHSPPCVKFFYYMANYTGYHIFLVKSGLDYNTSKVFEKHMMRYENRLISRHGIEDAIDRLAAVNPYISSTYAIAIAMGEKYLEADKEEHEYIMLLKQLIDFLNEIVCNMSEETYKEDSDECKQKTVDICNFAKETGSEPSIQALALQYGKRLSIDVAFLHAYSTSVLESRWKW